MSEKDFREADFDKFVRQFSEYLDAANESKKRGNNDYNPLLVIRYAKDEAKLHTRILHSFLDTNGTHYQDDLFLRLFLETLKLKDCGDDKNLKQWFDNTKNAQVEKEYYIIDKELDEKGFIDLYISNGEKHIILENKVDSGDGDKQIAKYIGGLRDKGIEYENIAVVYLTKKGDKLSQQSRQKWDTEGNFLKLNEYKLPYKQISYEKDILAWIEKCQKEVGNITSLNSALEFYKDIVKIITNQKESKMNIAGFFGENADGIKELSQEKRFEIAFEIYENIDYIWEKYLSIQVAKLQQELKKRNIIDWKMLVGDECESFCSSPYTYYWKNLVIYNDKYENQTFRYMFENEKDESFGARLSIRKSNDCINFVLNDKNDDYANEVATKIKNFLPNEFNFIANNGWWFNDYFSLWDNFQPNCNLIRDYFLKTYKKVIEVNEYLKNEENIKNSKIAKLAQEVKNFKA